MMMRKWITVAQIFGLAVLFSVPSECSDVPTLLAQLRTTDGATKVKALYAIQDLARRGPRNPDLVAAVPEIADVMVRGDASVRAAGAFVFREMGPSARAALPELQRVATDRGPVQTSEQQVAQLSRGTALEAIQKLGMPPGDVVPTYVEALSDEYEGIRWLACDVLRGVGPSAKDAVPALQRALGDGSERVRAAAKAALARIEG